MEEQFLPAIEYTYIYIYGVNYVGQTEIHIAEPLVPESSAVEVELATENLKGYN